MGQLASSEWDVIVRSATGDEYVIGSGPLPMTLLPDPQDHTKVVVTAEVATFFRGIADQIEHLHIAGDIEATSAHDADDLY